MSESLTHTDNATLPFEILGHVFSYVADGHPIYLRHVFFVCRSWYNAVRYHSTLWANIRFDSVVCNHFDLYTGFSISLSENYLRSCLAFSATAPLDVTLDSSFHLLLLRKESVQCIQNNIPLIIRILSGEGGEHASRWRSFNWTIGNDRQDRINESLSLLPQALPYLQTLRMHSFSWDTSSRPKFPRCPRLTTVEIYQNNDGGEHPLHNDDYLRVKELSLGNNVIWIFNDLVFLSLFRNILHLTLYCTSRAPFFTRDASVAGHGSVSLVHLRTLSLKGNVPQIAVTALNTPSLKEVCFNHPGSFQKLCCAPFARDVDTFYVTLPRVDGMTQYSEELECLLESSPAVTRVYVPQWLFLRLETSGFERDAKMKGVTVICRGQE